VVELIVFSEVKMKTVVMDSRKNWLILSTISEVPDFMKHKASSFHQQQHLHCLD
jgi:hypothetical protein